VAVLAVAFERLSLSEVVSFTTLTNSSSRAVMERIGMINSGRDFDHHPVPYSSLLRRHCLYIVTREQWSERLSNAAHAGADRIDKSKEAQG